MDSICKQYDVMPLWHFDGDDLLSNIRDTITLYLKNGISLVNKMQSNRMAISLYKWYGCFGAQTFISLTFLQRLQDKYNIVNIIPLIKNREHRMAFERIMGILITEETNYKRKSLLGNIHKYQDFRYTFDKYISDFSQGKIPRHIVKVWTGR